MNSSTSRESKNVRDTKTSSKLSAVILTGTIQTCANDLIFFQNELICGRILKLDDPINARKNSLFKLQPKHSSVFCLSTHYLSNFVLIPI